MKAKTTSLWNRLVLHRLVCRQFGYDDLREMLDRLRPARGELPTGGGSDYGLALAPLTARATVAADRFAEYDANIVAHSRRLRMTGEHGRTWKPHQYVALLFTEHYLHRYFDDPEGAAQRSESRAEAVAGDVGPAGVHAG